VLVVDRTHAAQADETTLNDALRVALTDRSVKEAATEVAQRLGLPRRQVYQAALKLSDGET
jgi:16S rRNA (cytidine1402-2'-O)-methyltransferase